jgi:hypothetical protein
MRQLGGENGRTSAAYSACQVRPDLASRGVLSRHRPDVSQPGIGHRASHTAARATVGTPRYVGWTVSLWVRGMVNENARRAAVMVGSLVAHVAARAAPEGSFGRYRQFDPGACGGGQSPGSSSSRRV